MLGSDICFCTDECDHQRCFRHKSKAIYERNSMSNFKGTKMCPMKEVEDGDE